MKIYKSLIEKYTSILAYFIGTTFLGQVHILIFLGHKLTDIDICTLKGEGKNDAKERFGKAQQMFWTHHALDYSHNRGILFYGTGLFSQTMQVANFL